MTKVSAVKANSYDYAEVKRGINEAIDLLGGISKFVTPGEKILLKPNMVEAVEKGNSVTTHPEVVRALIRAVKSAGGLPLVGDSPGVGGTVKVAEKCGIGAVCREEGVELVDFSGEVELALPEGRILKRVTVASALTEVNKVFTIAKMKTHTFMGLTGAVKNQFGFIVGPGKAQFHLRMKEQDVFAAMLVDLMLLVKPVLCIVDGIVGMEGNGPRNGQVKPAGVILAGENGFAVDMVMGAVMGMDAAKLPVGKESMARGLCPSLAEIDVVGSAQDVRLQFAAPRTYESLDDWAPGWLVRIFQKQFTARPEISPACIGCRRCVEHCPPQAMQIEGKRAEIDLNRCIRCYCCQELCPADAVVLRESLLLKFCRTVNKIRTG